MTITVKKLINYYLLNIDASKTKNEEVKIALQSILETHEKELAEKEQEINGFKQQIDMAYYFNQNLDSKIKELKKQILFKEDFLIVPDLNNRYRGYILKEKYDKLPNKDVK